MNLQDIAKLMTIAAAYDGRIVVDQLSIQAWHELLAPFEFEQAKDIVIAHQIGQDRHRVLHVGDIREALDVRANRTRNQIEADVRSAKARGIISRDWPEAKELDIADAARLQELRDRDRVHWALRA
jgi:hypothetical protein